MKRVGVLLFLCAACGGKIEETSDGTTSATPSGTTTAIPTGTTTSVPPTPPSPGQPAPGPSNPPGPSNKVLTAQAQFGGLDRITVFAADAVADSCVRVHLVRPAMKSAYPNVLTPKEWAVQGITRSPGAKRCGGGKQPPAAEDAVDAKGTITFAASSSFIPCSIDVHVSALFKGAPTLEQLDGDKIAVEGCQ